MNEIKSEASKDENLDLQEAICSKDFKKIIKSIFSYEYFVRLNCKVNNYA